MIRWLRFVLVGFRALFRPPLGVTDRAKLFVRVWATDADVTAANHALYLTYFELGRLDLQLRSGIARRARSDGWGPTVASLFVRYRRPLRRFQRAEVQTRIFGWDEQWLFIEHRLLLEGTELAWSVVRVALRGRAGRVDPRAVADSLGLSPPDPVDAARLLAYLSAERMIEDVS